MPKQVFAEDIERLIKTLEGVAAARVSATPGGEIDQIYVTAAPTADVRAVRRGVGTALVSTYGLPLEPWRIQIAQPRVGAGSPPRFRVMRIEETVAATEMTALVQLAWVHGVEDRVVTGRARGPLGPAHRLRTLVSATLDGAREALDPRYRKATVQEASLVTFFGRPTALVGISVATPRGEERALGIAQEEASSDAVVLAALDAVTKLSGRAALAVPRADRRAVLEAMRRYVGSSQHAPTTGGTLSHTGVASPAHALGREVGSADSSPPAGRVYARPAAAAAERARGASPLESGNGGDPAALRDIEPGLQTQPVQTGVMGMAARQDVPQAGQGSSGSGRLSIEGVLYQSLIVNRTPVHVRCRDGYELRRATLRDVDTESVLLEADGATELVYKHAILSIRPLTGSGAGA